MKGIQAFDLTGKTALVTGCNKGIGKAMAVGLAEAGADIIGVSASLARRSQVPPSLSPASSPPSSASGPASNGGGAGRLPEVGGGDPVQSEDRSEDAPVAGPEPAPGEPLVIPVSATAGETR